MNITTNPGSPNGVAVEQSLPSSTWKIDPAASRVEFTIRKRLFFVKHLVVTGRFSDVRGTITLNEQNLTQSHAEVAIGAASVDTQQAQRDKHLRKADFFDVERFPDLTFRSTRIEAVDQAASQYRVIGDLTVRGVTREVRLDAHYTPARRGTAARITLSGALNRHDFGLSWSSPVIKIADDLTIALSIEAVPAR